MGRAQRLLLVGCGKIGSAYLRGLTHAHGAYSITVIEPNKAALDVKDFPSISFLQSLEELTVHEEFDIVVIAVKPNQVKKVVENLAAYKSKILISLAAGIRTKDLATWLGTEAMIIRAMPNLPASIGKGITVALDRSDLDRELHRKITQLLALTGAVKWVTDESSMDAITALSGSGPAYVFALIEAMAAAGVTSGLDPLLSYELAETTVIGSAYLLENSTQTATQLRQQVTSPAGTTEAALTVLLNKERGLEDLVSKAILKAKERSQELAITDYAKN